MPNSQKRLVEEASKEDNVDYNLNALKYKLLVYDHDCAKCLQKCSDWTVVGTCHHIICNKCLDFKIPGNTQCPKCLTQFEVGENSTNSDELRKVHSALEEMVYLIQGVERNTLNEIDLEVLNNHKILSNFVIESKKSSQEASNRSTQEARNESSETKVTLESNNLSAISPSKDPQYKIHCTNDAQLTNNFCEPENDVIEGTPDKSCDLEVTPIASTSGTQNGADFPSFKSDYELAVKTSHLLNIGSSGSSSSAEQKSKNIVLTFTNLTDDEMLILIKVANMFNIVCQSAWTDTVTHLVTKQERGSSLLRTKKYMNALLSHCYIISFDWAVSCLESNSLLPEANYIVKDLSGEPSPLVSWKVGKGIVCSPLEWTKKFILFFHGSVENSTGMTLSDNIIWAKKAGFALASKLEDLNNDKYRMRFIIVDSDSDDENLVTDLEIISWIQVYKAVAVNLGWFLECLFRYQFLKITPEFQTILLNRSTLTDHTLMDESFFTFDD